VKTEDLVQQQWGFIATKYDFLPDIYIYNINGIWPSKTGNEIVSCKHQQRSDFQSAACNHHTCGVSRQKYELN
jgi:hypothetical protein